MGVATKAINIKAAYADYSYPCWCAIVLSEKFSLFTQVEVSGKLEAGAEVEFSYNKEEIFAAGVSYNGKDYSLNGEPCTEKMGDTAFKAYRCRTTKKDAFSIKGTIKGTAEAEAVLWIYPEIEFMVYRNVGANLSLEPGIYATTKIEGEYTVEKEIEAIAENHEQYLDANYQFSNLELGVKARARFRADLGLIYKKAGKEKTAGLAYPLCFGICSREERKTIDIGSYPLINLPKVTPAKTGSLGNDLTLVAQVKSGEFFTQDDGDNDINGFSWQLIGKAKDALGLPLSTEIPSTPVRVNEIRQKVTVADSSKLEVGETYTVRLVYWSEIHKIVRQTVDFDIIYNPPQDNPNLAVSISSGLNLKLTWDKVASATEYWIYKNDVLLTTVSATGDMAYEYIDTDSEISGNYTYQVVPVSDGGVQYGSPVVNYPVSDLPATPTNLVATPDDGLVTLNWSSNEANHRVHYATSSFDGLDIANYNLASNYISVDVISGTSTVIENLTNGTKYYFVVTALKDGKESDASNEVSSTPVVTSETIIHNGVTYKTIASPHTGKIWLDRNLGANKICTSATDVDCYGDYYQMGRNTDGHEKKDSDTTYTQVTDLANTDNKLTLLNSISFGWSDWFNGDPTGETRLNNWTKTDGNGACPLNYRVPTVSELNAELVDISSAEKRSYDWAFNTFLKAPASGGRSLTDGNLINLGAYSYLHQSDQVGYFKFGQYSSGFESVSSGYTTVAYAVRCIKAEDSEVITHNGFSYNTVTSPHTGRVWLDRNLGASRVCQSHDDEQCYGDYYQWGRNTDGHEKKDSATQTQLASDIFNAGNYFIRKGNVTYHDWTLEDTTGDLRAINWSKADGSSVCPVNFRVPTISEISSENTAQNNIDIFNDFLKIPSAGFRWSSGNMSTTGSSGIIWSSSKYNGKEPRYLIFYNSFSGADSGGYRSETGATIRCIKNITNHKVKQTGQVTSYVEFDDGYYRKGIAESFTSTNDYVIDENTNFMWQKHPLTAVNFNDASTYCEDLSLSGYEDWKLPRMEQLLSILTAKNLIPENSNQAFWSNQESVINPSYANVIIQNSSTGNYYADYKGKTQNSQARCVRGSASTNNYVKTGEIIIDKKTGLFWQDNEESKTQKGNFEEAISYCEQLSLQGYNDWRLPNINEFYSILDYSKSPAISDIFENYAALSYSGSQIVPDIYATSSTHPNTNWLYNIRLEYGYPAFTAWSSDYYNGKKLQALY